MSSWGTLAMPERKRLTELLSIPEKDAVERFAFDRHLECFEDGSWTGDNIRVHDGDLAIAGDLDLDFGPHWKGHQGLVVTGDLAVDGNVLNANRGNGAFLYVGGQLTAVNLIAGGSYIAISGDADIGELVLAHDNDGALFIAGETRAQLVISDDHDSTITTSAPCWNSHDTTVGMPLSDHLHAEIPIEREPFDDENDAHDDILQVDRVEARELIDRIRAGESALRHPSDKRPLTRPEQWRRIVDAYWATLKHVPAELIDSEMCRSTVEQEGWALQYVPAPLRSPELCAAAMHDDADAFPFVPEALRTEGMSRQAVGEDGSHLRHVPVRQRTKGLCALAIQNDAFGSDALDATPEALLGPDLYLLAVQSNGRNLRQVPMELRTLEICMAAVRQCPGAIEDVPNELRALLLEPVATAETSGAERLPVEQDGAAANPEALTRQRPKLAAFGDMVFSKAHFAEQGEGRAPGWFESRPIFFILLRALVSVLFLVVHVWLTATVWANHGLWAAVATFLGLFLAEIYWSWQFGGSGPLAILCIASVTIYWLVEFALWRLTRKWAERGILDEDA